MSTQADFSHGSALHRAGDLRQAEQVYRCVLRAEPRSAPVWFALAQLCEADRRPVEAAACFRQALQIEPHNAEGWFLLGNVLLGQGKYADAEPAYRRCLRLQPGHTAALVNLGFALGERDRLDEARACYEQALGQRPDQAEIHHNLGNVLREQGQLDAALGCYEQALRLRPDYAKAHINRGIALVALGRIDAALVDLQRGVALQPNLADAHNSLGSALSVRQHFDEALAEYERALALNPQHAEAAWNQSLLCLLLGDYQRGWPAYEWRFCCKRTTPLPAFARPRWDGAPLAGRTILLYGEQGLGDTLHFVRYAALVKAHGGRVIVQCQNALLHLLSRTPGIDGLVGWGAEPPAFDVYAPLMSLPALFGTTLETIPATVPYVFADPKRGSHWRAELASIRGLRVGIAWQGSPRHAWDRHRSVALEQFEPLAKVEGVRLISLQKGHGSEQLAALNACFAVHTLPGLDEGSGPFMDTAAVLANLDLVVTVDSALAHLAGAMGVPTWVALTFTPDWRWLLGRADSVWYPTLRLFRQTQFGDWPGVFAQMADALRQEATRRPLRRPILVEVSPGELLDKIAMLEAQRERSADEAERDRLCGELAALETARQEMASVDDLAGQLKAVHERLWQIEDDLRWSEREQDFGPRFVESARALCRENDRRAALRRAVDERLGFRGASR
jgi:tetratricopeptide (TPR) repeat protein